jgi:hypothetical protein
MLTKNVFIKRHRSHAGKWIYKGYKATWESLGYSAHYYDNLAEISSFKERYYLMAIDGNIRASTALDIVKGSQKTFLYVQPNWFPEPWGLHPNFQCHCPDKAIEALNELSNVFLWSFGGDSKYHNKWKSVATIPLAFDSINYKPIKNENYSKYDICFIGGWADNGFDEKRKIMIEIFSKFMKSGLNCGFFINKNISHEQETMILNNSKITLNIHDAYQRILGNDTNERTFKSLGLNGLLVSDTVRQLNQLLPNVKTSLDSDELVKIVKDYLSLTEKELNNIKEENRQNILDNHCYTNRVEQLLDLK